MRRRPASSSPSLCGVACAAYITQVEVGGCLDWIMFCSSITGRLCQGRSCTTCGARFAGRRTYSARGRAAR
eukprot:10626725-Heterocapsa_arctica.AAC.1